MSWPVRSWMPVKRLPAPPVLRLAILCLAVLLLLAPRPGVAQTATEGWNAYDMGDYQRAESIFKRLADEGDPDAMFGLGRMAYEGLGRPVDYGRAARWYGRAAEFGHTSAQLNLGYMNSLGLGVPRSEARAEELYRQAVDQGDLMAINNVAYIWAEQGRNLDEALRMIREVVAAAPEEASYLDTLGWVLVGLGRYERAIPPMCRAVILEPGHPELRKNLGDAYWLADNVPAAMQQWRQGLALYESPALLSQDGRPFVQSEAGLLTRAELEERMASGLPGRTAPARAPEGEPGIETQFIDECQIPTT